METSDASEALIQALISRGWCFGDTNRNQINALIVIHSALLGETCSVDSIESELSNMDLRSIGGKSLPDRTLLHKSSYLQGPKVLQISSVRDISRNSIADCSSNSQNRRLLRLNLTDGHTEITAVEYSHVPSIPDDVVPGTKVRLENKAAIHSGIVCLNPKVVTVLGGVVQSLYEEWQMNQKYSGFSRSSLRLSQESDTGGPPPFEKLHIEAPSYRFAQQGRFSDYSVSTSKSTGSTRTSRNSETRQMGRHQNLDFKADNIGNDLKIASHAERTEEKPSSSETRPKEDYSESTSKSTGATLVRTNGNSETRQMGRHQNLDFKEDNIGNDLKIASPAEKTEEKPSSSETRPKEVAESVPVQNQAAAQKLLQKMNHPNLDNRNSKGRKYRGKGKQEEVPVFTLDEWERRKAGAMPQMRQELPAVSRDEDLAWQLQNQFDLEDLHVRRGPHEAEAEHIRMSMFKFERDDGAVHGRTGFRERGRGRGRGRGRRRNG